MRVVIAGGHGKVARHLSRFLVDRGDTVVGLIRDADQSDDLRDDGAEPAVVDLETVRPVDLTELVRGADVASVLAAVLADDHTVGHVFEVVGGGTPIDTAIDAAVSRPET